MAIKNLINQAAGKKTMAIMITTTSDDKSELEQIATFLVEDRLAACCQIVGPITSVYRWQAGFERTQEWMCQIKTEDSLYDAVEIAIRQQHHYDEPEIIATQIVRGSAGYLKWLSENVSP
jgi:periplasmic divalent cation tolerance protein